MILKQRLMYIKKKSQNLRIKSSMLKGRFTLDDLKSMSIREIRKIRKKFL
jgi:hypothetical protein